MTSPTPSTPNAPVSPGNPVDSATRPVDHPVVYSIRLLDAAGDIEDLADLYVVGTYPTRAARDAELVRLRALPGDQLFTMEPSGIAPWVEGLRGAASAEAAAACRTSEELAQVVY